MPTIYEQALAWWTPDLAQVLRNYNDDPIAWCEARATLEAIRPLEALVWQGRTTLLRCLAACPEWPLAHAKTKRLEVYAKYVIVRRTWQRWCRLVRAWSSARAQHTGESVHYEMVGDVMRSAAFRRYDRLRSRIYQSSVKGRKARAEYNSRPEVKARRRERDTKKKSQYTEEIFL